MSRGRSMSRVVAGTTSVLVIHPCDGPVGGAERYVHLLGRGLTKAGVRASLLVTGREEWARSMAVPAQDWAEPLIVAPGRSSARAVWSAIRRAEPDVLHWNFPDPFAFEGAALTLLPWPVPSVATDHLPMLRAGRHREWPRALANRRLGRIIVVGDGSRNAAEQHWPGTSARWVVVRNGVELPAEAATPRAASSPLQLLFVGRLEDQKDPAFAVSVTAELVSEGLDVRLSVAGTGRLAGEVARAASLHNVPLAMLGHVDDVGPAMAAADVLLAPSRFEGLPFVPLEAIVHGLPAVVSDIPPHRELARLSPAIVVPPGSSPAAWSAAVRSTAAGRVSLMESALADLYPLSATRMVAETRAVYAQVLRARSAEAS